MFQSLTEAELVRELERIEHARDALERINGPDAKKREYDDFIGLIKKRLSELRSV
jgi:hypothetical protein